MNVIQCGIIFCSDFTKQNYSDAKLLFFRYKYDLNANKNPYYANNSLYQRISP